MYNTQHLVFKIGRTIFVWREQGYEFKVKLKAYEGYGRRKSNKISHT